jgi:hypothetical protein
MNVSETKYRLFIVVLLGIAVVSFIGLGLRFVENGRYEQWDHQKENVVFGNNLQSHAPVVLDTRTGQTVETQRH